MKKLDKKSIALSIASVVTAATLLFGGATYAYLQDNSEAVVNTMKTNKVLVDLYETKDGEQVMSNEYSIIPGATAAKDPTVTVNATIPAYVYVEVTDKTDGLVSYTPAPGWDILEENGSKKILYRTVVPSETEQTFTFTVLKDNIISYDKSLENSDMIDPATGELKKDITLTFKAFAIQQEGFEDAYKAYYESTLVSVENSDNILEEFEKGNNVKLNTDVTVTSPANTEFNMADGAVLDLNGKTLTSPYMSTIFQGEDIKIQNGNVSANPGTSYGLFIGNGSIPTAAVVENVTVKGGINVFVADVVLRNVTVDASSADYYAVWADEAANITIESGTYIGGTNNGKAMPAVLACDLGTITIKGGTFNSDVSAYVADGYTANAETHEDGTTWYTVVPA